MTIVWIETGLPASGKSTHARSLGIPRFNLDDYRAMLGFGDGAAVPWNKELEEVAVQAMIAGCRTAIKAGYDVVIDNTHLVPRLPKRYRKEFGDLDVYFKVWNLTDVSAEECIRRDAYRSLPAQVGGEVIRRMAKTHEGATKNGWRLTEKWMNPERPPAPAPYEYTPLLPWIILCDIDGTIAHHEGHRGPFEWDKVGLDTPNQNVIGVVETLRRDYEVIFFSGRDESCRKATVEWLHENISFYKNTPRLFMRPEGDMRPDFVVKAELFDQHIRGKFNVLCVLDDRNSVIKMWRSMNLTVLQVAEGDF